MKKIEKINKNGNFQKSVNLCKNYLMNFSNWLIRMISNIFRKINNKLNIYSQLKREYNFQNSREDKFIYMIGLNNGAYKSITNIIIISEKKDNQQNYFNC